MAINLDTQPHNANWLRRDRGPVLAAPPPRRAFTRPWRGEHARDERDNLLRGEVVVKPHGIADWRDASHPDRPRRAPFDPTHELPDQALYAEARQHPQHSYARAFGMRYDGPTGPIRRHVHRTDAETAEQLFRHGVPAGKLGGQRDGGDGDTDVHAEVHHGHSGDYREFVTGPDYALWRAILRAQDLALPYDPEAQVHQAARDCGYAVLTDADLSGALLVLDPGRVRLLTATNVSGGPLAVKLPDGTGKLVPHQLPPAHQVGEGREE